MNTGLRGAVSKVYRSMPQGFIDAVQVWRTLPYWRDAGAIFVHVPKAAGTSISIAVYGTHNLGHYRASQIARFAPDSDFQRLFKFAFVRNPWDRIYSSYHFLKQGGTQYVPVTKPLQYKVPEFSSFDRFVKEWLSSKDLMRLDPVLMPQSAYVLDKNNNALVDFIGHVETLEKDMQEVGNRLKRNLNIGHVNEVKKELSYRSAYTDELKNIIGDLYEMDVKLGPYDF